MVKRKTEINLSIQYKGERAHRMIMDGRGTKADQAPHIRYLSQDLLALGLPPRLSTPSRVDMNWKSGAVTFSWIVDQKSVRLVRHVEVFHT